MKILTKLGKLGRNSDFIVMLFGCGLAAEIALGVIWLYEKLGFFPKSKNILTPNLMLTAAIITMSVIVAFKIFVIASDMVASTKFPALTEAKYHIKKKISERDDLKLLISRYDNEDKNPVRKEIIRRQIEDITKVELATYSIKAVSEVTWRTQDCLREFIRYIDGAMSYICGKNFNKGQITEMSDNIVKTINTYTDNYKIGAVINKTSTNYEKITQSMITAHIKKLNDILLGADADEV